MAASRAITRIRSFTTANPVGTGLGAAVVTVAAVIAVNMMGGEAEHPQAIPPAPRLSAGGRPVLRFTSDLGRYRGELVRARGVAVESVPADEGFWIGAGPTRRVWVKIRKVGESPLTVKPGQWVSFSGEMAAHSARFARRVGVSPSEGAAQLTRQAHHIDVNERDLQITRADLPGRRRVS